MLNLRNGWLGLKEVSIRCENEELSATFKFVWNLYDIKVLNYMTLKFNFVIQKIGFEIIFT